MRVDHVCGVAEPPRTLSPNYPCDMLNESFLVQVAGIEVLSKYVSLARGKRVGQAGDFQRGRGQRLNIVVGGIKVVNVFISLHILRELNLLLGDC